MCGNFEQCWNELSEDERLVLRLVQPEWFTTFPPDRVRDNDSAPMITYAAEALLAYEVIEHRYPAVSLNSPESVIAWQEALRRVRSCPNDIVKKENWVKGKLHSARWRFLLCSTRNSYTPMELRVLHRRKVGDQGYKIIAKEIHQTVRWVLLHQLRAEMKCQAALGVNLGNPKWQRRFEVALAFSVRNRHHDNALSVAEALALRFDRLDRFSLPGLIGRMNPILEGVGVPPTCVSDVVLLTCYADMKCYWIANETNPMAELYDRVIKNLWRAPSDPNKLSEREVVVIKYCGIDGLSEQKTAQKLKGAFEDVQTAYAEALRKVNSEN